MLPIYKITIDDKDEVSGFTANSLVDMPAHGKAWLTFSNQKRYTFNEENRTVMGVAISVNTPIFRSASEDLPDHYVLFDRKTTERIALKAFKTGNIQTLNRMHDEGDVYTGVTLYQSFIIDRKLGVNPPTAFSGQNLQDGSWVVAYKVEDEKTWNEIKSGKFVGFSIEGYFDTRKVNVKNNNKMSKQKKSIFEAIFGKKSFESATTTDGVEVYWDGELAVGAAVFIEVEGEQVPAPEGMHSIAPGEMFPLGVVIEVDINGIVTAMEEPTEDEPTVEDVELREDVTKTVTEMSIQFKKQMDLQELKFNKTIKALEDKINALTTGNKKFQTTEKKVWQKSK
jgi:hypothetical protein